MIMHEDEQFMRQALALAAERAGFTSPNPMVGAVLVKNGRLLSQAAHHHAGADHAEVAALKAANESARGATMYVTLEPCNHHGRTPPCTEAIIAAGVAKVHYAIADPNPAAGGGHERLEAAGIIVKRGLCEVEARALNRFFFHYVETKRPFIIIKFASSLDGKIATRTGDSKWISCAESRQRGHALRQIVDGILIGAETAVSDNPRLTTRLEGVATEGLATPSPYATPHGTGMVSPCPNPPSPIHHPIRIVLDSRGRVPLTAQLFQPTMPAQTIVATTAMMPIAHRRQLERQGVLVWEMEGDENGRVSIPALLDKLGQHGLMSILVEGGGQIHASFFAQRLVQEVWAFIAPLIIGGADAPDPVSGRGPADLAGAFHLQNLSVEQVGTDLLLRGIPMNSRPLSAKQE